ncbi:MAG: hypothetical protein M0018_04625 [Nitrospiraceae bacterium]|nr:hypothetical protein [Nitrospiraceae bacterium]
MPGKLTKPEIAAHVLASVFFIYALLLASGRPLSDPDIFWHLKAGQETVSQGHILRSDPFCYTSPAKLSPTQLRGIRSQWLGQALLYLVYAVAGIRGLLMFRGLFIVMPFVAFYLIANGGRREKSPWTALSIAAPALSILVIEFSNVFERPQAFSFVFVPILLYLLERAGRRERRLLHAALLCLLMALWANIHGGFILGFGVIVAWAVGLCIESIAARSLAPLKPVSFYAAAIAASGLNPNGFALLLSYVGGFVPSHLTMGAQAAAGGDLSANIIEYKPLWFLIKGLHFTFPYFIFAFFGAILIFLIAGKARPAMISVALFLSLFASIWSRGVAFALIALPFTAYGALANIGTAKKGAKKRLAVACSGFLIIWAGFAINAWETDPYAFRPQAAGHSITSSMPSEAAGFIAANNIEGPMLNKVEWGGYLIWRLYPRYKVFLDGQLVNISAAQDYLKAIGATPGWRGILDKYRVKFIVTELVNDNAGQAVPLALALLRPASGWELVFCQDNSAVFVKEHSQKRLFELPAEIAYEAMLEEAYGLLAGRPDFKDALFTKAIALYGLGRNTESGEILQALPGAPEPAAFIKSIPQN